jgi:IMP dehydrogenase
MTYDDITLIPRQYSELTSRSQANTSVQLFNIRLDVPLIASPMPDVCDGLMARELAELGALGIIHRFQSIESQVEQFKIVKYHQSKGGCAIGVTGDYLERFDALYKAGCLIFCLDTANGFNIQTKAAVEKLRSLGPMFIMAGNIATAEAYHFMAELGVDAVRVGIAGGSVCTTRTETGIYFPMVNAIIECAGERYMAANTKAIDADHFDEEYEKLPKIIADGGIKKPADFCKALALGADAVMAGGIFAGTDEAPGMVIRQGDMKVKLYRGAASFSVQQLTSGAKPEYNEGDESFVPYKGAVSKVIARYAAGLRSSMSYMNAKTLAEYYANKDYEEL